MKQGAVLILKRDLFKKLKKQSFGFLLLELLVSLALLAVLMIMVTGYQQQIIDWSGQAQQQLAATKLAEDFFEYVAVHGKPPYATGTEKERYTITWQVEPMMLLDTNKKQPLTAVDSVKKIIISVAWKGLLGQEKSIKLVSGAVLHQEKA